MKSAECGRGASVGASGAFIASSIVRPIPLSKECGDMVKVSLIKTITRVELRRLAQSFIREVKVRKEGIDLVVRGDGFKKLMGKE